MFSAPLLHAQPAQEYREKQILHKDDRNYLYIESSLLVICRQKPIERRGRVQAVYRGARA
jgi:hypothetical protein